MSCSLCGAYGLCPWWMEWIRPDGRINGQVRSTASSTNGTARNYRIIFGQFSAGNGKWGSIWGIMRLMVMRKVLLTIMYWCLAPDGRRWWQASFGCIFWDFPAQAWQRCSMAAAYYLRLWHWRKRGRIAAERRKASGRHPPYAKY